MAKFWEQPWYQQYLKDKRQKREQNKIKVAAVQALNSRNLSNPQTGFMPEYLRRITPGMPYSAKKEQAKVWVRKVAEGARKTAPVAPSVRQMPDRVVDRTSITPRVNPQARMGTVTPGMAPRVPAAPPVPKPSIKYKVAPGTQPGQEVYVNLDKDQELVYLTSQPTDIKLFNMDGQPVFVGRDDDGNWALSQEQIADGLNFDRLMPATYTPDLPENLNYTKTVTDLLKPITVDGMIQRGQQLFYDSITHQITSRPTQVQFFFAPDGNELTDQRFSLGEDGQWHENLPATYNERTDQFLKEMVTSHVEQYDADQLLERMNYPARPEQIASGNGQVSIEQIRAQGKVDVVTGPQDIVSVDLGGGDIAALTQQTSTLSLPFNISSSLKNSKVINTLAGIFLGPMGWFSPEYRQKKIDEVVNAAGWGWIALSESSNVIKQGPMSSEKYTVRQSGFPDMVAADLANILSLGFGFVLSSGASIAAPLVSIWEKDTAQSLRDYAAQMRAKMQDKNAIMVEQTAEAVYRFMEQPAFGWSPTQREVESTAFSEEQYRRALGLNPNLPAPDERTAVGQVYSLQRYVDNLNRSVDQGLDLMVQGIGLHQSGLKDEALDFYAEGYYKYFTQGLDWAAINNAITGKDTNLQQKGVEALLNSDVPVTQDELKFLWRFMVYGQVENSWTMNRLGTKGGDAGPYTSLEPGVNYEFMRHLAERRFAIGRDLTLDEIYEESQTWLTNWFANPDTLQDRRAFLQGRVRSIHDRAQSIKEAAVAYSKLGDQAKADEFMRAARNLLVDVYDIDRKSNTLDAYSAYTWDAFPERKQKFYEDLAEAELQLGRPLTRQEIIDISYHSIELVYEMGGEAVFDILNVLEFAKVGKVAINAAQVAGMKALIKVPGGTALIDDVLKAGEEISNLALIRSFKGRALLSQAHKQAQAASNLVSDILRSNPRSKEELVKIVQQLSDGIKAAQGAATRDAAWQTLKNATKQLPKTVADRALRDAMEMLVDTINPDTWGDEIARVWDEQVEFMTERARVSVERQYKRAPVLADVADLNVVKANKIRAEVLRNMTNWAGRNRLAVEFGDGFRRAFSEKNRAWTDSVILSDTWYAKLGGAGKELTPIRAQLRNTIDLLYAINQKFMKAWVWATLARRPSWMLYNFMDNTFRFFVSGAGDLGDIAFLLRETAGREIAESIGVPAGVTTDMQAASFRVLTGTMETGLGELKHIAGIDELRQNPLGFLQHYMVNYQALTQGRGPAMHLYSIWRAFPMSVKSLASTIEYGSRIRMYYKLFSKNVVKLNRTVLANLIDGIAPTPGSLPVLSLKQRLLATGMNEADAERWVKYVKDMWWATGNNGSKFEYALQRLSQTGRYRNESMFLPQALRKADWFDEELHRPLIINVLDELQKFVTEQSKTGLARLTKAQTDQFFDRVIATLDAEIEARTSAVWGQQYQMLRGFDEVEGYKNYKSGPYYPKMEADSGEKITESGHKALQDIPGGTTTLSNKQRKSISKAIKDNGVVLSGDTDKDLLKGVEILRERAEKSAKVPLTDAQAKAIEDGLKNITPADVPTNADEIMAADKLIDENVPTSGRLAAGSRQSAAADEFRKLSTPVTFENNPAYRLLSKTDKDLVSAHARHLEEQMRNFSGRVRAYWIYSNPGPILFDSSGRRILRSRTTGAAWDQYDLLATRLYDNQVSQFGELVDAINTGTFHPGVTYTVKDMLDKAGISLNFDNQGRLVRMRMNNPATGEWEEITDPAALNRFKKITGVTDQKVYDESIQLMDANRLAPKEERVMRIAAKLIPSPHKSYDEMVQSTPRLALAITEKRLRDANLILAGEFKYPMFYEKAGSLIPTDDRLMKRILSETKEAAYKTLDDVPPDVVHQVLDRWAQTSHGYEMGKMVKTLEKDMVEVLMRQFGWKEAGAREFFKLYDKTITNLANFTTNVTGKLVTREEMWTRVFYGFYKMEPGTDGNLLRFVDGRVGFQSNMSDFIERVMTDQGKGADLLANLRLHGFSDIELKWNGMYKWLQDNKTANISQASMRKFLAERERFISGEIGRGGVWEVTLRNSDAAEVAKVHGSLIIDPADNLYSLRLDKIDGSLDEHSLKRMQRWARDNDADKLVMPDGIVHDLRKIADSKPPLRPMTEGYLGSIDWVKNALDQQTALIKSFSGANITTASHEMFHAVYPHLPEEARAVLEEWADESLLALKDSRSPAYRQFAKVTPEVARNEIITKAWEKYLVTEVAPNAEIGNIFKSIRSYLINTYRTMKDYFAGVYLTPEVRQVFDQMVGDGWKKQKAAAIPKPKGPGPKAPKAAPKSIAQVEEEVKAAVRKSKATVTSKPVVQKDTVTKVAEFIEASDFDVAEGRWLANGTFYVTERDKLFFEGSTARDVVDHELNDLRNTLQINPSVDLSTIKAENTGWVAFDKKVAKKYNRVMGRSAKNMPMYKMEYFRVLAVDENGTALVEFSHTKPDGLDDLTQFQNVHSNQSLAEIVNSGDPSEFRSALLDLLDVVGRDDLEHLIDEMTPIIDGIEAKFIHADWKLAPKQLTDIEIEAFSTLADLFIDSEKWFNLPSKPVQRFVSKFKDYTGKLQELAPVRILNIKAIQDTNQLANLFLDVAQAIYKPLNDGKLPRIQRVTDKLVEVFERRGFDARVMVDNLRSDVVHDALIAGWKLEKNLPPNTPEFMKFAKDSQVQDADGLLTVVYHGSISDFTEFRVALDLGHHFGTPYAALDRVRWREGRVVHGYWLNITNPITLLDEGGWGATSVVHLLRKKNVLTEAQATEWLTELNEVKNVTFANVIGLDESNPISLQQANEVMYNIQQQYPILKEHGNFDAEDLMETWNLGVSGGIHRVPVENRVTQSYIVAKLHRDYGYDGVKYVNAFENAGSTSWIAFYKNQIKRVDNPGTFNPKSNDTLFQSISRRLDSYEQRAGTSKLALESWTNTLTGMLDNPHQLFLDADTGFMNANALVSDPKALSKPTTAYLIGNGFDYIHREMGEAASRDYIRALATALRTSGLDEGDIFHMGGSRFVVQMSDPKQLDNVLRVIDEAPTVRVSDMTGEVWDVDLNISHSGAGPNTQIPEQYDLAQRASERVRAEAYKQWAAEAGDTAQFRSNWEALDNADNVGAEIHTHPYIRPADPMFQAVPHSEWYYRKARVEVEKMDFKSTSTARLRSVLPKFVSQDEMKWSGLDDFLAENRNVTKEEVLGFLNENRVQVKEVVFGDVYTPGTENARYIATSGGSFEASDNDPDRLYRTMIKAGYKEGEFRIEINPSGPTRHDSWVLPGGMNQREVALWAPGIEPYVPDRVHFTDVGEGRAISWFRGNDRVDIEGKRVFFIEEIQSQRHQEGRRIGYRKEYTPFVQNDLRPQTSYTPGTNRYMLKEESGQEYYIYEHVSGENAGTVDILTGNPDTQKSYADLSELLLDVNRWRKEQWRDMGEGGVGTRNFIPPAPFSKNWEELTLKRIIRWASENDYDRVAWTTGKMQAERYSLAKFYDHIRYIKNSDDTISLTLFEKSGRSYDTRVIEAKDLSANVGMELAKKITDDPNMVGELKNVDLETGGEFMLDFYDVKIPNIVKKSIRKWGSDIREVAFTRHGLDLTSGVGQGLTPDMANLIKVQGFDVTPEMKRAAMAGEQSLWQRQGSNGYFSKAKQPNPQPEIDLAWRTFAQSPIFEHGSSRVSLVQLWNTLFGSEELMLIAGPKGFANITSKLAQEYLDRGMLNQAEVMRSLSALADNFQEYISGSVIKLDALVPPPLPMWNNNPVVRQWVSNLYGVGSELEGSKNLMRLWKEEFGTNIEESPLAMLDIGDEASKVLDDMAQTGARQKSEINDIANYGGRIGDELILSADGAVTATNFNMIDYTDFSQFDQFMKDFVPFWMYPAKSIPFWLKSMVQHPELVMFYNKYMRWSEMAAISYDAVNSQGEPLPSLKGYMPLLPGLWFNPLAPFMFRYVFPRVENIPDEREELTPVQSIAKFLLDDAPIYGINISPAMSAALQTLYEPYYPKTNLAYEFGRTLIPLEFIPPFMERWLLNTVRKIAKGNVNIPERFQEEVSWKDYLIEREILTNALLRMKDAPNLEAKEAIAKEAYAVITRDESLIGPREEDPIWLEARSKIENGEYYRRMAGMFTGIYTKEFSSGQAELNLIRDEVNSLRNAVNDEVSAVLFYPYMTQADIYDAYTTRKYKTPEGWIWNAYQMTRYVTDEEGQPMEGQLRRNEIARQAIIDNQTQLRYAALKAAADLKDQRLLDIPVGADDLRDKIMQEYYETLAKINDPEGLYPLAQKEYVMGYKPIEKIQEHITSEWWRQLRSTYPHRSQTETWTQYELRVEAWKDNLPNQAAKMLPIFQTNFNWNIFQGEIETEERMAEVPNILKGLLATSNRDGYEQYVLQNDGVVEAIWNAYEDMYLKPYYDAIKNKSGNERRLAELEFFKSHPLEPGANEIQQWITGKYGPDKFGSKLIRDTINGLTFASLDEINKLSDKPKDPDRTRVFDILAWAGPQQSENYKALVAAYIELGGYESDFDVWWGTGGDVNNYADVEQYYEFVNRVKQAGAKLGAEAPNEQQLRDMLSAEADQAEFKTGVLAELGGNFYTTLALYMNMSSSERKEWRNLNKDLYKKINRYYEMRDEWAKDHELWASYYYPAYALQTESPGGVSAGSGGGYKDGGYSGKGYSTFEQEERAWWIPMGKRSSLDVMALFSPGKLGSAGVTDKPWWPDSLLKLLDPTAVEEVQAAAIGQAPLSNATVTYLGKVAKKYPEYTQLIRSNIKKIKRTYPVRELAKDMRKFV